MMEIDVTSKSKTQWLLGSISIRYNQRSSIYIIITTLTVKWQSNHVYIYMQFLQGVNNCLGFPFTSFQNKWKLHPVTSKFQYSLYIKLWSNSVSGPCILSNFEIKSL